MKKQTPLFWVFGKLKKRIPMLLVLTGCQVASALLGVSFALGTRNVIDCAIGGERTDFVSACLVQAAIIVGLLATVTMARHLRDRLTADLDRDWKQDLFHGLLNGDYEKVSAYHSGELVNRLNNDVRIIDEGLLSSIPGLAAMATKLVSAILVLIALAPWFSVVMIGAGLVVILATGFLRKRLKSLHKQVSASEGKVSGFIQESLEKLLMVQAMGVSKEIERRADDLMEDRYVLQRKRKNVSLFANTSVSLLSYGAGFAALVWCAFGLLEGRMTFGTLTAVTQLVGQLQGPFVNLSGVIPRFTAMTAAAERLQELEQLRETGEEDNEKCALQIDDAEIYEQMTAICGEKITFAYDRDVVFDGASFALPKGSFAAVTGASGIGKSTLLKLMLGLFSLDGGRLYAACNHSSGDGIDLPLSRATRALFAYVPQGNLLFSGTLRENLMLTRPEASKEEIDQAVYVSAMDEFLDALPEGLDTVIGENGEGLSEGQAQRLAIGRAILGGAPILLLDEITSSLDTETEQKVLTRIRQLPDKTCIVVTHRPAALDLADWILEVGNGNVICREK